jgi:hypothetical protein
VCGTTRCTHTTRAPARDRGLLLAPSGLARWLLLLLVLLLLL